MGLAEHDDMVGALSADGRPGRDRLVTVPIVRRRRVTAVHTPSRIG